MDWDKSLNEEVDNELEQVIGHTVDVFRGQLQFFPLAQGFLNEGNSIRLTFDKGGFYAEKGEFIEDGTSNDVRPNSE